MASAKNTSEISLSLLGLVSVFFGAQYSSLFYVLGCAFFAGTLCAQPRYRTAGIFLLGLSLFYLTVAIGYNVGKDLAKRDNAKEVATQAASKADSKTPER